MKARVERFERRAQRKRELALHAMADADIPKLIQPDFTASLRQGAPTLEVVAEDKIPAVYWKAFCRGRFMTLCPSVRPAGWRSS